MGNKLFYQDSTEYSAFEMIDLEIEQLRSVKQMSKEMTVGCYTGYSDSTAPSK